MQLKRFALLVENEVFDVIVFPDDMTDETYARWITGIANNPIGMDVTEFNNCYIGSIWNGSDFDNSEVEDSFRVEANKEIDRYAMLANNKVFMLLYPAENQVTKKEMYKAAFSTNTIFGMDITNMPEYISFGWIWDGENFLAPEVLL